MSAYTLPITTVVNVSVSQPGKGLSSFQVNNLALITNETPIASVPAAGYFNYIDAAGVATDWGTTSEVYSLAQSIFAQAPNILTGGGQLVIYKGTGATDTILEQITLLRALVYIGGVMAVGWTPSNSEILAAGADAQTNAYFLFAPTNQATDYQAGGLGPLTVSGGLTRTRVLYYSTSAILSRKFAMAYASRAMSTNFTGSNTTSTMELKDLATIQPDTAVTLSIYTQCLAAGVDVYSSTVGLSKVRTSGANGFFDDVYNLNWFVGALQVAAFNALATTSTKIPQTEAGMTFIKRQFRNVCEQSVRNGFVAHGAWNSPDTFGDPETFLSNILTYGYYVYSLPVALQSQVDRAARKAPLTQIAIKYAGAVHSAAILVNINA